MIVLSLIIIALSVTIVPSIVIIVVIAVHATVTVSGEVIIIHSVSDRRSHILAVCPKRFHN